MEHAAFADERGVPRLQAKQEVDDRAPTADVAALTEDGVQVQEHPLKELPAGHSGDERLSAGAVEVVAAQAGEQLFAVEAGALVEGVDEDRGLGAATADDEVAGIADSLAEEADALGNLHIDQRESNREAGPTPDDLVEVAVGGVAVVLGVPMEA